MLFILTGDIQTGKTRWLQQALRNLEERNITPYGVIAPGQWIQHETDDGVNYEKLGIDNELLPQHEIIPFARRSDLISADDVQANCTQAERAKLGWAIDDAAIARVNDHFDAIELADIPKPGLLVIDEFGRLELLAGEGLTSALRIIDRGPTRVLPHALIVVRKQLLDQACDRFAAANWGEIRPIAPSEEALRELLAAFEA